ncbi:MAG TPA: hypothetical protein VLF93_01440 [Candidatus Saccharimonadales bacterium]|nr:hypothetical protein [Candidatus Saccharimonadales bacterium]
MTDSAQATQDYDPEEDMEPEEDFEEIQTYLSWHSPGRPYKKHSIEYFTNSFLIMMALEIILFLFSQYLLMALVFSLVFLAFALAVVPPRNLYYRVSSEGIRIEDHYFIWDELYDFYFVKSYGQEVLHIRTKDYFPGELTIVLGDIPLQQVKSVLIHFLPFREYVKPTFMEKAATWLERNFPLERTAA